MMAVIQRVSEAKVVTEGEVISHIGKGMLVLLGVEEGDDEESRRYLVRKLSGLRIFEDAAGKINLSIKDIGGEVLLVSQFTLAADCRRGNRPSFDRAADPVMAEAMYLQVAEDLRREGVPTVTGRFGAAMKVQLVNDGPVTIVLDAP